VRRSIGYGNCFFEKRNGFGQQGGGGGIEGGEGLALLDARAATSVEEDAGVGIDGGSSFFSSCPEPLHGPTDFRCVHRGDVSGLPRFEHLSRTGFVKRWVIEDRNITALRFDHLEKNSQGGAVFKRCFGQCVTSFRRCRFASQMNHPAGKNQREGAQIFALGVALPAQQVQAFHNLDPVASRIPATDPCR